VREYADQTVEYVRRALGLTVEYDSDTLPVLDHYLRSVPKGREEAIALVASTAGAYFGEVVRRRLGGAWDLSAGDPGTWRMVLPGGLSFSPAGLALAAILLDDDIELDTRLDAPPRMRPVLEGALERMGAVSVEEYYSLCCRLDTLEHLQDVLLSVAAAAAADRDGGTLN
jgi:hypothetical protein